MNSTTTATDNNWGGLGNQTATIIVLSGILVVLLICLPLILFWMSRGRSGNGTGNINRQISHKHTSDIKVSTVDNELIRHTKETDNISAERELSPSTSTGDVADIKHDYESIKDTKMHHCYNNLILHANGEEDAEYVFNATSSEVFADEESIGHFNINPVPMRSNISTENNGPEDCDVHTMSESIPTYRYTTDIEPHYLDMSAAPHRKTAIELKNHKRKKRHVGSLYSKPKPRGKTPKHA